MKQREKCSGRGFDSRPLHQKHVGSMPTVQGHPKGTNVHLR